MCSVRELSLFTIIRRKAWSSCWTCVNLGGMHPDLAYHRNHHAVVSSQPFFDAICEVVSTILKKNTIRAYLYMLINLGLSLLQPCVRLWVEEKVSWNKSSRYYGVDKRENYERGHSLASWMDGRLNKISFVYSVSFCSFKFAAGGISPLVLIFYYGLPMCSAETRAHGMESHFSISVHVCLCSWLELSASLSFFADQSVILCVGLNYFKHSSTLHSPWWWWWRGLRGWMWLHSETSEERITVAICDSHMYELLKLSLNIQWQLDDCIHYSSFVVA